MTYGTIKVDTVTFTNDGVDKSVTLSGLVQNPTFSGNVTVTGTLSGVTVTGTTANFTSGNFTNISGGTHTITSGVFAAGSAASPSITFTGDLNTGIYSPGADQVAISTNGTGRLFVDASGNVGVGLSSPATTFGKAGSVDANGILVTRGAINAHQTNAGVFQYNGNETTIRSYGATAGTGAIVFNTGGGGGSADTERLRITSAGLVGIGTSSPGRNLHVAGSSATALIESTGSTNADLLIGDGGVRYYGIRGVAGGGSLQIRNDTANTTLATFTSTGLVGIGTTSPGHLLDVNGDVAVGIGAANGNNYNFRVRAGTTGLSRFIAADTSDAGYIDYDHNLNNWIFRTNSSEAFRVDSSQRLLVGTSSNDSNALAVVQGYAGLASGQGVLALRLGTTRPTGADVGIGSIRFESTSNTSSNYHYASISAFSDGASSSDTDIPGRLVFSTTADGASSPTERLRIDRQGNVGIGTTSPNSVLQVNSGTNLGGILVGFNSGSSNFYDADLQVFRTGNGTERARIDSAGRVGIGTTSPGGKLVISDGSTTFQFDPVGGTGNILRSLTSGGSRDALLFDASQYVYSNGATEYARIDSSGRLLVGTSSYSDDGTIVARGSSAGAATQSFLILQRGQTNPAPDLDLGVIRFTDAAGSLGAQIAAQCDGGFSWGTNDYPTRLVFSTTADGASSPTQRLVIQSDGVFFLYNTGALAPNVDNTATCGGNGFRWSQIWAANGTIQTSDQRAKTDVSSATLGADFIKSLRPVSYKWIEGGKRDTGKRDENNNYIYESAPGERTHWGFIAQEVKQVVDAAGVDFGGWVLTDKDDPDSQQALRYDQFIAPLTKALQEALEKIETLETKVAALESA